MEHIVEIGGFVDQYLVERRVVSDPTPKSFPEHIVGSRDAPPCGNQFPTIFPAEKSGGE